MATTTTPNAVTDISNWNFQNSYVERLMDHSALTSAHPDDTLVLAGPPRYLGPTAQNLWTTMKPLGGVQNVQITSNNPVVPAQAIGSGRYFYLVGKPSHGINIARLFIKGKNLARAFYDNAIAAGIKPELFDDKAAAVSGQNENFLANMDSELFKIPFGLAILFRDKIHEGLGAVYIELCLMTNWSVGFTAGQSMILENVNLIADRIRPIDLGTYGAAPTTGYPDLATIKKAVFQDGSVDDGTK